MTIYAKKEGEKSIIKNTNYGKIYFYIYNNNNIYPFHYTNTDKYRFNADMNISPVTSSKKIAWFSTFFLSLFFI